MTAMAVLGPLRVTGPGGPVRIDSARQRRLLVALAAHAGRAVEIAMLTELVWDAPPADPAGAVQTHVSRLRRVLPPEVRIETAPDGYALALDRPALDVTAFADRLAAAAAADVAERPDRIAAALALWRGRPFAEVDHPALQPEVARLVELRAAAAEKHADALLAAGRGAEAVAAAEALVVAEPLRESAVALLMRALAAEGRQADALSAFARLRERLADELGLDPSAAVRDLQRQVLRQQIPPPAAGRPPPVPLPVSSFVGRDDELSAVDELLRRHRVVTLSGPGGVGKTRLALHAAARAARRYADGVLVVELGEGGAADVEPAVATALRLGPGPGALADRIVEVLAVRRLLLVVDNCEHVVDAAAGLVEAVARGAPGVDLLATSREPLRVDGEHVLQVAPLTPDAAAALLSDRLAAAAAAPEPDLVPELCRRLDHLPLALELAAGRAGALGVRGLLAALDADGSVAVLRGGRRTAAARHRSLTDLVAWSHGLLDEPQQRLFERLAVFAGPVERTAVAAVCGDVDTLPDLVERSLVLRVPGDPDRFGLLETLRAFGRTRLARDPDAQQLRERHAAWAARFADELAVLRRGPAEPEAVRRFDAHLPDLRRAHAWLCVNGPVDDLLRLSVLAGEFAYVRARADLVRLVDDALDAVGGSGHPLVPHLVGLAAGVAWQRGDLAGAEEKGRRAVELAQAAGEPAAARFGHEGLANAASFRGDLTAATYHASRMYALAREAGDEEREVLALWELALDAAYAGDATTASRHEEQMAALAPRLGSATARAVLAYTRGELRAERGDPSATEHLTAAIAAAEEADSRFVVGIARHTLLTAAARDGDAATALPAFEPLLDHWYGLGMWTQVWIAVRSLATTLSRLGRHRDAAVLLGALGASPRATNVYGTDSARLDGVRAAARTALGPEFDMAAAEGAALGDHDAVERARGYARAQGRGRPPAPAPP